MQACDVIHVQHCAQYVPLIRARNPSARIVLQLHAEWFSQNRPAILEERRGRATGALMSAFALASVLGVPIGLALGLNYGWHAPFQVLAPLGLPVLFISEYDGRGEMQARRIGCLDSSDRSERVPDPGRDQPTQMQRASLPGQFRGSRILREVPTETRLAHLYRVPLSSCTNAAMDWAACSGERPPSSPRCSGAMCAAGSPWIRKT